MNKQILLLCGVFFAEVSAKYFKVNCCYYQCATQEFLLRISALKSSSPSSSDASSSTASASSSVSSNLNVSSLSKDVALSLGSSEAADNATFSLSGCFELNISSNFCFVNCNLFHVLLIVDQFYPNFDATSYCLLISIFTCSIIIIYDHKFCYIFRLQHPRSQWLCSAFSSLEDPVAAFEILARAGFDCLTRFDLHLLILFLKLFFIIL